MTEKSGKRTGLPVPLRVLRYLGALAPEGLTIQVETFRGDEAPCQTRLIHCDDLVIVAVGVKRSVELPQEIGPMAGQVCDPGSLAFL